MNIKVDIGQKSVRCGNYIGHSLEEGHALHNISHKALYLGTFRCHPFRKIGSDPFPAKNHITCTQNIKFQITDASEFGNIGIILQCNKNLTEC